MNIFNIFFPNLFLRPHLVISPESTFIPDERINLKQASAVYIDNLFFLLFFFKEQFIIQLTLTITFLLT